MRRCSAILLAALVLCGVTRAQAAEKGLILRAGDLLAQPFIDAAKSGPVTANQPVTILERRGAWASVESNGAKGWVRLLNLRLEPGVARAGARPAGGPTPSLSNPTAMLRTGSTGRTATTGVKGMDEEDIKNASPDYAELETLGTLAVSADDARAAATKAQLKENAVAYLDKGRSRK